MGKMRMFLRQTTVGREPLAIAMSGVRMGERLLQIGMDTPVVTGLLAAKPGLSGESSIVLTDEATAARARRAVSETGALVNVAVHPLDALRFDNGSFDVVIIHSRITQLPGLSATQGARALSECQRVLRPGGRVIVLSRGTPSGLTSMFRPRTDPGESEGIVRALEVTGFRAVRILGDRDGYRFVEGLHVGETA
jgi:ubiquinone/menaquinone biosynthesis C-methylase UbiE